MLTYYIITMADLTPIQEESQIWGHEDDDRITLNREIRMLRPKKVSPVECDLRTAMIANLQDGIQAGWNGWEQACKFQDDGLQAYYMKWVTELHKTLEKIKKF